MKQLIKQLTLILCLVFSGSAVFAQITTSSLSGRVTDENQEPLTGAAIVAVHTPSGTQYAAIANESGRFNINGMRAGGPYTVEVSFLGMSTVKYTDVTLTLGEPFAIDVAMKASNELDAVVLTA